MSNRAPIFSRSLNEYIADRKAAFLSAVDSLFPGGLATPEQTKVAIAQALQKYAGVTPPALVDDPKAGIVVIAYARQRPVEQGRHELDRLVDVRFRFTGDAGALACKPNVTPPRGGWKGEIDGDAILITLHYSPKLVNVIPAIRQEVARGVQALAR